MWKSFPLRYKLIIHSTLSGTEEANTAVRHQTSKDEKNIISKIFFRVFPRLMNVHIIIKFSCDANSINTNPDCFILEANMV